MRRMIGLLALCLAPLSCQKYTNHGRTLRIAVIPRTTGTQLWEAEHAGVEAAAQRFGVDPYWNAPTREDDVEHQIWMVENAIGQHYDAIVLSPDQPLSLLSPVSRALAQGIKVVIIGMPIPLAPRSNLKQIVNDDDEVGKLAARRMAFRLGGKGNVAVVGVDSELTAVVRREHAFRSELARTAPLVHIVDVETGPFNRAQIEKLTSGLLTRTPEIMGLFTPTSDATQGAAKAVRASVRSVVLIGCDQDFSLSVKSNELDALAVENTYTMGEHAIEWIITGSNNNSEERLQPLLVTKENVDRPDVQRWLSIYSKKE